jgi:hypothetical protein
VCVSAPNDEPTAGRQPESATSSKMGVIEVSSHRRYDPSRVISAFVVSDVTYDAHRRLFDARSLSVSSAVIGSFALVEMIVQPSP